MIETIYHQVPYRVAFRLYGGHNMGMGHVVRCLAIAQELGKRQPVDILFVVNNSPEVLQAIEKAGFPVKTHTETHKDEAYQILYQYKPDLIFNDLPHSSEHYMKQIQPLCPTMNYDDGGSGCTYADYLIHVTYKTRPELIGKKGYFYGPQYLILRDEFFSYRKRVDHREMSEIPLSILIIMGGSDPASLTVKALDDIESMDRVLDIKVVTGAGFRYRDALAASVRETKHTILQYTNISADKLINLIIQSEIGIVHYGITAYEMACMGLPFVAIAHNKEEFDENRLTEYGFCLDAGLWDKLSKGDIAHYLTELLNNKSFCEQLSIQGMSTVDARGLVRVTDLILNVIGKTENGQR